MNRKLGLRSASTLVIAISLASHISASAQSDDGNGETRRLETVIVSSQKREQTLQDIPVAVSVTDEATIEQAKILDINDLQSLVPSLRVAQFQSSEQTNFVIRGFGNGANAVGVEPSVGVFIDGVYRSRSAARVGDLPNVKRIEVLRGPQSILFGKNASAGVINIVTAAPQFTFGGGAEVTFGNYNQRIYKADITGPVSDTLAFSLAANQNTRDGYIDNLATDSTLNERDRWGVRGQLLFQPNDSISFRLIADYDETDDLCCGAPNIVSGPASAVIESIGGQINPSNPFDYQVYIDRDLINEIKNSGASLQSDFEFDSFTLTSITAYRENSLARNVDVDFTNAQIFSDNTKKLEIETFTQEFRLTSTTDGPLDWLLGAFYFNENVQESNVLGWGPDGRKFFDELLVGLGAGGALGSIESALSLPNGTFFQEGTGNRDETGQTNEAFSIFSQLDYHLTDSITITGGLNYTKDEKSAFFRQTENSNLFDSLNVGALSALQFYPPFLDFPNAVESGKSSDEDLTWTLRIAGDVSDNLKLYASAASGFKATSWNLSRNSLPFASDEAALTAAGLVQPNQGYGRRYVEPEQALVYELGAKAQFETVAFNVAIFDQEIEDYQTNVFTGSGYDFQNAQLSVQGLEFDLSASPIEPLTLTLAGTFLNPEFTSVYTTSGVEDALTEPAGIHETSLSLTGLYEFEVFDGQQAYIRADHQYESDVRIAENAPADVTREVNTTNASAGVSFNTGWRVQIWGRNIFDDEYLVGAFPSPGQSGNYNGYPNTPVTYGITVVREF